MTLKLLNPDSSLCRVPSATPDNQVHTFVANREVTDCHGITETLGFNVGIRLVFSLNHFVKMDTDKRGIFLYACYFKI